jgi:radical SAM protein (TIGR01212 family)
LLVVEFGLQSIHERSLLWLGRGHDYAAFLDAAARTRDRGLTFGVHVILGLPGEDRQDILATARAVAESGAHSVKLHNLYAVRDTRLADLVGRGEVRLPGVGEFAASAVDFLEVSSPDCVIDRLGGTAPPEFLIAPSWCLDKSAARKAVDAELVRRDSWQGRKRGEGRGEKEERAGRPELT